MPAPPSSTRSPPGRAARQTTPPARPGTSPTRSNASPPQASSPRRAASAQSSCAPILRRKAPGTPRTARWAIRPAPRTENARHRSSDRSPAPAAARSITSTWQEAKRAPRQLARRKKSAPRRSLARLVRGARLLRGHPLAAEQGPERLAHRPHPLRRARPAGGGGARSRHAGGPRLPRPIRHRVVLARSRRRIAEGRPGRPAAARAGQGGRSDPGEPLRRGEGDRPLDDGQSAGTRGDHRRAGAERGRAVGEAERPCGRDRFLPGRANAAVADGHTAPERRGPRARQGQCGDAACRRAGPPLHHGHAPRAPRRGGDPHSRAGDRHPHAAVAQSGGSRLPAEAHGRRSEADPHRRTGRRAAAEAHRDHQRPRRRSGRRAEERVAVLAATAPILIAASVFFLALVAVHVLDRAFEQYKDRYVVRSTNDLSDMFLFIDPAQLFFLNLATMALLATVGFWLRGPTGAGTFAVAGFFAPVGAVRFYKKRRLKRFDTQLTEALQQMANSLRAGLTLPQAIEHVGRESAAPLGQEFGLFVKEVKL